MSLDTSIKKTIDYALVFGSCINKKEIKQRLISKYVYLDKEIDKKILNLNWKNKKNKWKLIKIEKTKKLASKIGQKFKEILFLGISGSVATGHPKKNDDIDIVIITKTNNLWKTRLKLRWWIFINHIPHRKYGGKERRDQFCFNLWLDESEIVIPSEKHNLKNAIDLILLTPLINKNYIYEKFIRNNSWAKKWVATPYHRLSNHQFVSLSDETKNNFIDKFINYLYFWPQYLYMKRKFKGEKVNLHQAFFHKRMIK